MNEIDYCKDCEYYQPENKYHDCRCRTAYLDIRDFEMAKDRVLNYKKCQKFHDEIKTIQKEKVKEYVMPFGKYKGMKLKDIDDNYIAWLRKQEWLKMPLKLYVESYCHYLYIDRLKACSYYPDGNPDDSFSLYREVGYGELC